MEELAIYEDTKGHTFQMNATDAKIAGYTLVTKPEPAQSKARGGSKNKALTKPEPGQPSDGEPPTDDGSDDQDAGE